MSVGPVGSNPPQKNRTSNKDKYCLGFLKEAFAAFTVCCAAIALGAHKIALQKCFKIAAVSTLSLTVFFGGLEKYQGRKKASVVAEK